MTSIRKSAHFKYNPKFNPFNKKLVDVRRGKEQTRKQLYEEHKKRRHNAELNPMAFIPVEPKAIVLKPRPPAPKPRTRKPRTASQNTQTNNSLTLKKVPVLPKPRSRKPRTASQNNTQSNIPKPKARSRAFSQNNTRTNRPKPRARSRAFSQNNTTL